MTIFLIILMVLACVCILMQALQINVKRIEIGWLGLFFWALAITIPMLGHIGQVATILLVVLLIALIFAVLARRP